MSQQHHLLQGLGPSCSLHSLALEPQQALATENLSDKCDKSYSGTAASAG